MADSTVTQTGASPAAAQEDDEFNPFSDDGTDIKTYAVSRVVNIVVKLDKFGSRARARRLGFG